MAAVNVVLDPQFEGKSQDEILRLFDEEVELFSKFMESLATRSLHGGALINAERVLLKTYLVARYRGHLG